MIQPSNEYFDYVYTVIQVQEFTFNSQSSARQFSALCFCYSVIWVMTDGDL